MISEILYTYFPDITQKQKDQFEALNDLYRFWNAQINVISRKDIDMLYVHHVLHSLGIAKVMPFLPGEKVMDVGTGGGFPGIPLAILFPETQFHLVDSIGKKIKVVKGVVEGTGLDNVQASHARAEEIRGRFHFIISRAVTRLNEFYPWIRGKWNDQSMNSMPNGVLYLKGGDLSEEIAAAGLKHVKQFPLNQYFEEEFFETKAVVYFPAQ